MVFNPNQHLIQLKSREGSKDYLPVMWRLAWFREVCPDGTIDTQEVCVDLDREVEDEQYVWNNEKRRSEKVVKRARGYARFRAIVTDGKGASATGTKSENAASFPDYIEKAETGAIGRALAALGYGTQFAPEFDEGQRLADAPVVRGDEQATTPQAATPQATAPRASTPAQPTQDKALTDMLNRAKRRAESLGVEWDSVKSDANLSRVEDSALVVHQIAKLNEVMREYERNMKTGSAA